MNFEKLMQFGYFY